MRNLSNIIFITMFLLLWINGYSQTVNQAEIQYTHDEVIWPGCFGVLGSIQNKNTLHDLKTNGILPQESINLQPGYYTITGITANGENWRDNEVYLTAEMLEPGFECARYEALGRPCPPDAGICNRLGPNVSRELYDQAIAEAERLKDCIEEATIKQVGDSLIVQVCEKRKAFFNPQNKYSLERAEICEGETYDFYGRPLKDAGTYQHKVTQDSVIILNLDVTTLPITQLNKRLQPSDSTVFAGETITSGGTFRDTLQTEEGCDSIIILNVSKDDPNPCDLADSAWQQNGGVQLELFATSDSKTGYGGQSLMKVLSPQFAARAGYEWRLVNNSFWLNNQDCVGESIRLYGGLKTTPKTFIEDGCACNNVSNNNLLTYFVGGEYRAHLYKLWPVNFSLGLGGEILYNKINIDNPELSNRASDFHGDIFLTPRVDYTVSSDGPLNIGAFVEIPIRFFNNPFRGIGINMGVKISIGGGSSKSSITLEDEENLLENNPSFESEQSEENEEEESDLLENNPSFNEN